MTFLRRLKLNELTNLVLTLRSGRIWNNTFIDEDFTISNHLMNPSQDLENSILNDLYLRQTNHKIIQVENSFILSDINTDFKNKRLSSLNEQDYMELIVFIHSLEIKNMREVFKIDTDSKDIITILNKAKNDGLIMLTGVKNGYRHCLLSDLFIKSYTEVYLPEIKDFFKDLEDVE